MLRKLLEEIVIVRDLGVPPLDLPICPRLAQLDYVCTPRVWMHSVIDLSLAAIFSFNLSILYFMGVFAF